MPRGKKKIETDQVLQVGDNAKAIPGSNSDIKVYTSKPKSLKQESSASKELTVETAKAESIQSFVHVTIYWIPNCKQFLVEDPFRGEGKSIIAAPCSLFKDETTDIEGINAVLGMHFSEATQNTLDTIRKAISEDRTDTKVYHLCEIGMIRSDSAMQYVYLTY